MAKEIKKIFITWEQFDNGCNEIAKKIQSMTEHKVHSFNSIYGIPRGGLVIAVKLSHLLNLELLTNPQDIRAETLIVDDLTDFGDTLQSIINNYFISEEKPVLATFFHRKSAKVEPVIWLWEKFENTWIVFPWENPKAAETDMQSFYDRRTKEVNICQ